MSSFFCIDSHNAHSWWQKHRFCRSPILGKCLAHEHRKITFLRRKHSFTDYTHLMQTLTTITLGGNYIGDEGVRYIATSLSINKVRELLRASIIDSLLLFHADNHEIAFSKQQDWSSRSKIFGLCIKTEHGNRTWISFNHASNFPTLYRHLSHCILSGIKLKPKERSI